MSQAQTFARVAQTDDLRQDLKSRSILGVVYTALGGGGELLLRLVSTAILARILIPEHFGLIGMVTALTAIAGQLSQLGLSTVTVQRRDIDHDQITNLFWVNVACGAGLTTLFCALSPLIAAFYHDPRLAPITMAVSMVFLWGGLLVQHEALLIRQMKQAQSATIRLVAALFSACLAVALAIGEYGYWALVWQEITRSLLTTLGVWLLCPWRPGLPKPHRSVRSLLRFGTDLTLSQIVGVVISNADQLLVGRIFGAGPLGLYRQAQQLIAVPLDNLSAPIGNVSHPGLSILQDDPERYRRYYQKTVFLIGLTTMPIAAFTLVYAEPITLLILGAAWTEAAFMLRFFAAAALIRPVLGTATNVLITCGHSKRLLTITLAGHLARLGFTCVGALWGVAGVVFAQLATPLVLLWPTLHYSFAGTPVTLATFFRAIRTPLVATATMTAGLVVLRGLGPEMGSLTTLSSACIVGGSLFLGSCMLHSHGRAEVTGLLRDVATSLQASHAPSRH